MVRSACMILPALLVVATPARAEDPAPKPKKPKLECRSFPRTNSRFSDNVCHTHEEWEAYDTAAKSNADGFVNGVLKGAGQFSGQGQTGAPR